MNKPDEIKWIKVRIEGRPGSYHLNYEDGLGIKVEVGFDQFTFEGRVAGLSDALFETITPHIRAIAAAAPTGHYTGEGYKTIPIAVFLDILQDQNFSLRPDLTESWFQEYLSSIPEIGKDFQIVYYTGESTPIQPFSLPFNIRFTDPLSQELAFSLTDSNWYKNNIEVAEFGLTVDQFVPRDSALPEGGVDILMMDLRALELLTRSLKRLPKSYARLLVILYPFEIPHPNLVLGYFDVKEFVRGHTALLLLPAYQESVLRSFFKDFMYSIIHDFPLHEAFHYAIMRADLEWQGARLYASPGTNHSLRMSDALESFKTKVHDYGKLINPGNFNEFISKFAAKNASVGEKFRGVVGKHQHLQSYFRHIQSSDLTFHGESTGLVPISQAYREFVNQQDQFKQIQTALSALVNDKEAFEVIREEQERKVDVTLDELSPSLVYSPIYKNWPLRPGGRYRLNVSIGQGSERSLMEGDIPSIDPLLPDPVDKRGHEIDIVVYGKDFSLLSPSRQTVYLPLLGGTDIMPFIIEAPAGMDQASLRIGIFFRNNILQAFLLTAQISGSASLGDEVAVRVVTDLATSQKFTNLDQLKPRDLYIGVNGDGHGTHTLFIKKEEVAEEISGLNETILKEAQAALKVLLSNAAFENGLNKYPAGVKPGDVFFDDIRAFARFGSKYHGQIFSGSKQLIPILRKLIKTEMDITIGRHALNFSFPWALLYDYTIYTPGPGEPDHPVCMGAPLDANKYPLSVREDGKGCRHNPGLHTYCIEGFWGVRHRIEQLLSNSKPVDVKDCILNTSQSGIAFCNNIKEAPGPEFEDKLKTGFNATHITHQSDLLSILWDPTSRPSALVVLGHMETKELPGEPPFPRILTFPRDTWSDKQLKIPFKKWIYQESLYNKIKEEDGWTGNPLPIIFLINCSNAGMNIEDLNSLVSIFSAAGATAIVGTECNIKAALGVKFVQEVLDGMYHKGQELGEAIRQFNRDLIASGNPLAFVFTCFGNINLKLIK